MFSAAIKSGAAASAPLDAQFNYVTMLLHADGTNGATNGGSSTSNTPPFNTDASTNAFTIVNNGDTKPNNFNPYQGSYYGNYFDGTGDYLTASGANLSMGTGDFTIEFWFYALAYSSTSDTSAMFDSRSGNDTSGFLIGPVYNDINKLHVAQGVSPIITASTTYPLNTWVHCAVVRSSGTITLYQNGVNVGSVANSTNNTATTNYIASGYWTPAGAGYMFNGYLSNFRIVKGTAVYTGAFTPPTSPLTAISGTALLTCQSNRFIDSSSNTYTVTPYGTPSVSYNQPFTLPSTYSTYGSGYFDGSGDYLKAANNTALQIGSSDFTIECWYYSTVAAGDVLWSKAANGSAYTGYYMNVQGGGRTPNFYATANGSSWAVNLSSSITLKLNSWNHIAVTRNGSTWTVWVNGVSGGTATSSATILDDGSAFTIGALADATSLITGYVSDLRFVKGTAIYTTTFTPPTAPLTAITNTQLLTLQTNGAANDSGFIDSSPNDFPITRYGNTTQGSFSPYGSNWSNYFNGSGDNLSTPNSTPLDLGSGSFTIEAWIYVGGLNSNVTANIVSKYSASNTNWMFNLARSGSTYDNISFYTPSGSANANYSFAFNTWYHVAVVRNGTSMRFYVNGVDIGGGTFSVTLGSSAEPIRIGAIDYSGYYYYWNGYLSNVRIVKGTAVYTGNFTPSTTPLTAISGTSLLTCQSNRFVDNSGNSAVITPNGTPSVQRFNPFGTSTAYSTATIGGSGYFDGSGDYLTLPAAAGALGTGDWTVEFWYQSSTVVTTATNKSVIGQYASGAANSWGCKVTNQTNANLEFAYYDSTWRAITGTKNPNDTAWHHIAFTRVGTTLRMYMDGVIDTTGTLASSNINFGSGLTNLLWVGGLQIDGVLFAGNISDLRITTGTALYTSSTYTVPTAPLSGGSVMLNFTNAAIYDNAMMNDLETVGNAQISTSVKKYGTGSMSFSGGSDCAYSVLPASNALNLGDFTIECWVYCTANANQGVFQVGGPWNTGGKGPVFLSMYPNGKFQWGYGINTSWYESNIGTFSLNTWIHVAIVRASGNLNFYVNGVQTGSTFSGAMDLTGTTVAVGSYYTLTYSLNGYVDDFRITKGYARYTTNFTPPTAALPDKGPISS